MTPQNASGGCHSASPTVGLHRPRWRAVKVSYVAQRSARSGSRSSLTRVPEPGKAITSFRDPGPLRRGLCRLAESAGLLQANGDEESIERLTGVPGAGAGRDTERSPPPPAGQHCPGAAHTCRAGGNVAQLHAQENTGTVAGFGEQVVFAVTRKRLEAVSGRKPKRRQGSPRGAGTRCPPTRPERAGDFACFFLLWTFRTSCNEPAGFVKKKNAFCFKASLGK